MSWFRMKFVDVVGVRTCVHRLAKQNKETYMSLWERQRFVQSADLEGGLSSCEDVMLQSPDELYLKFGL